ncbi:MAG TPA: ABC transporter permease [Rhodanobacteraceae bacterium]|nr:ABC transporter permease [Rhodanobacteraceae bacterium]
MLIPALRRQMKTPLFALAVMLLVAAVVAINATAFGAIHALRWKALPYADADRLVELQANLQKIGFTFGLSERFRRQLADDRAHFDGAFGFTPTQPSTDEADRPWRIARVTTDFEHVLGVVPAAGRGFVAADANGDAADAVLLSDAIWRSRFGADPAAIGRRLRLGDRSYFVIGVMPRGFAFPDRRTDAWLPLVLSADERARNAQTRIGDLSVVARLASGATVAQACDKLGALFAADERVKPTRKDGSLVPEVRLWRERFAASNWQALALLQLAALILLAVVVATLINLALDHLLGRSRELQIRCALGAGGSVIARSVIADLAPPLVVGLALGLAATPLGLRLLERRGLLPDYLPQGAGFDFATLAAGIAIGALVLASALVAAFASRETLRLSNRTGASGLGRLRGAMLVGQIMLTTVLIGSAGLLLRSAVNLVTSDRGFDETGVLATSIDAFGEAGSGKEPEGVDLRRLAMNAEALRADITGLPDVTHAAIADVTPFSGSDRVSGIRVPGLADVQQAHDRAVGPDYFAALGIGLLAGRDFVPSDAGDTAPVIVDERYVQRYLHGVDPTTATVGIPDDEGKTFHPARILGVVRSTKNRSLDETDRLPTIYTVSTQPGPYFWLVTRADVAPEVLAPMMRERVLARFPHAHIEVNRPLAELVAQTFADRRNLLEAVGGFASMTLLLAGIGLATVLGFAIRRRTGEIGVRMALGATPARIRRLVLHQGGYLIAAGIALGLVAGLPLARLFAGRLVGVTPADPATWCTVALLVAVVALFACWLPARRASATDPTEALRHE